MGSFVAMLMRGRRFLLAGAAALLVLPGWPHGALAQSSGSNGNPPAPASAAPEAKPPQIGPDDHVLIEAPLAAELFRSAEDGCMRPLLVGRLQQHAEDPAQQLTDLLVASCEPIISAARNHLRAAGALAEGAPAAHDIAVGIAEAMVRGRSGLRPLRSRASGSAEGGPILSPGGVLTSQPPFR